MKKRLFLSLIVILSSICSAAAGDKGRFHDFLKERVSITGYGQAGYLYDTYNTAKKGPFNEFSLYRIMLVTAIEPVDNLVMGFMGDFAKFNVHEYWAEYRFCDAFRIKMGQFKTPYTIESNMSPSVVETIKGALAVQYLAGINGSDAAFGPGAGRDLGIMASGDIIKVGKDRHHLLHYRIGLFNGEPFNVKETNNHKDLSVMVTVSPLSNLKFTGSIYSGVATAKSASLYGDFDEGDRYKRQRLSVGTEFVFGPVSFRGEFLAGLDGSTVSRGAYGTMIVSVGKHIGILAAVDYLDKNVRLGDWQNNYTGGLEWRIARKCRLQLQYVYQHRRPDNMWNTPSSHLVITQLQLGF